MESRIKLAPAFCALMDASSEAFALIDQAEGQFVAINHSFNATFGYSLDELNQLGLDTFYGISGKNKFIQKLINAAHCKIFFSHVKAGSGDTITVELSTSPIQINKQDYLLLLNKPHSRETSPFIKSGILSIEQAFSESEARWRAITEYSPDHIMMVDTDGIILFINHTVPNLTVEEVIGKPCYDFTPPDQLHIVKENYSKVISSGKPVQFDIEYQADGVTIFLDNHVGPVFRDGRVVALVVACRDVTDRVKALRQLEKSQQHLQHALMAGKTGTWEWDMLTNEIIWSDGVEAMFGMEPGSFKGSYEDYRKLIFPDDLPMIESSIKQAIDNNAPYYVEHRCVFPDGSTHWLSGQGEVYRDKNGTPLRMIGTVTDITQRKTDEERIIEQEFLLSKSQEIAHIGSFSWDIATNTFYWSDEMHRIFGISKEEFNGNPPEVIDKAIHPDDRENVYKAQEFVVREKKPYPMEYRVVWSDGTVRTVWAEGYLNLDRNGEVASVVGTVQDITERKKAESALRASEQKLAMHFQHTPLGVIGWNTDLEVTEWNPSAESIFGFSREEAIGKSAFELILNDTIKPQITPVWQALLANSGGEKNINENITRNGEIIICEWYNTPLVNNEGQVIGISSLVQDITDRIVTERELEKHRLHLEELVAARTEEIREQALIIDQIHDSLVTIDLNGNVTSWNRGAGKMFGFQADEAIGKNIQFIFPEDRYSQLKNNILPMVMEKSQLDTEIIAQRKSGECFYVLLSLSVRINMEGETDGVIVHVIDITDRKKTEKKILKQQHELESANKELEAFSYSVSHDLRSPLRAIDGFSAALLDDYYHLLDDFGKDSFLRIRKNAQRMAALIDDLLELSRVTRHQFNRERVSLSHLAQDIVQKYTYEYPDRDIDIQIEENLSAEGDSGLLRIALDNLISNAWKYTTKTETPKIQLFHTEINGRSAFCIKDNGVGFDMRYVNKLFGAFQRLHAPEEFSGNGIGLATVARIISRHGGKIWAEGAVNKGSSFFFTLSDH